MTTTAVEDSEGSIANIFTPYIPSPKISAYFSVLIFSLIFVRNKPTDMNLKQRIRLAAWTAWCFVRDAGEGAEGIAAIESMSNADRYALSLLEREADRLAREEKHLAERPHGKASETG
jgi:hypothetical protein